MEVKIEIQTGHYNLLMVFKMIFLKDFFKEQ